MSASRAQNTGGTGSSVLTINLANPTSAGNLIVVACEAFASSGTPTFSVADNNGNSYASTGANLSATVQRLQQFYAYNIGGKSGHQVSITATGTGVAAIQATIEEYSGFGAADPNDKQAQASGFATQSSGNTAALSQADELVVAAIADADASATFTVGSGYSANSTVNGAEHLFSEYQIVASTSAVAGTFNGGSGSGNIVLVSTFKASSDVSMRVNAPINKSSHRPAPFKPGLGR